MPDHYALHSFHLNIGVGDCSIHLLVKVKDGAAKPTIEKTVFIDGGLQWKAGLDVIESTVAEIKKLYSLPENDKGELKYDSIIVTHWDKDHWGGLFSHLQSGWEKRTADSQIPFLRYSTDKPAKPTTVLYAPYWFEGSDQKCPSHSFEANPKIRAKGGSSTKDTYMKLKPLPTKNPKTGKTIHVPRKNWPEVLKLVAGTTNILGIDILSGKMVSKETKIISPESLLKYNKLEDGHPGMFCVAVNAHVLGDGTNSMDEGMNGFLKPLLNRPSTGDSGYKNAVSISIMVLWPNGRRSHYLAGDAVWEVEEEILTWLETEKKRETACVKLSHHGAVNSTPINMMDKLRPKNVIISAGDKTTHAHPRFEAILYVDAWMATQELKRCICVTNYPYYMLWDDKGEKPIETGGAKPWKTFVAVLQDPEDQNMKVEMKGFEAANEIEYIDALQSYYKDIKPPIADPWTEFIKEVGIIDFEAAKAADKENGGKYWASIVRSVEKVWKKRCYPLSSAAVGAFSEPTAVSGSPNEEVQYYLVESVDDDLLDGRVYWKTKGVSGHNSPIPRVEAPVTAEPLDKGRALITSPSSAPGPSGISAITPPPAKKPKKTSLARKTTNTTNTTNLSTNTNPNIINTNANINTDVTTNTKAADGTQTTGTTSGKSTEYYIIYSSATGENISTADGKATTLSDSNSLDLLVGALHRGVLVLDKKPSADAKSVVVDKDEWAIWMRYSINGALTVAGTASSDASSGPIASFTLTVSGFPAIKDADNTTGTGTLVFTTAAATLTSAFGSSNASRVKSPGILTQANTLVLGLSSTTPSTLKTTVGQLMAYAGIEIPSYLSAVAGQTVVMHIGSVSDSSNNAVWFLPWLHYTTEMRLTFSLADRTTFINLVKGVLKGFSASSLNVILRTNAIWLPGAKSSDEKHWGTTNKTGSLAFDATCTVTTKTKTLSFRAVWQITPSIASIRLVVTDANKTKFSDLSDWLNSVDSSCSSGVSWATKQLEYLSKAFHVRSLSFSLANSGSSLSFRGFSIEFEVTLSFGASSTTGKGKETVVFLFTYSWTKGQKLGSLSGGLWCQPPSYAYPDYRRLLYGWENWDDTHPNGSPPPSLNLLDLFPSEAGADIQNLPVGIPTHVTRAVISISDTGLIFGGTIVSEMEEQKAPYLDLGSLSLDASYRRGGSWELSLLVDVALGFDSNPPSRLRGRLSYDGNAKTWSVSAVIESAKGSSLHSLFDADARSHISQLLEHIEIPFAELEYHYGKGDGSEFSLAGILLLGPFELDLEFSRTSSRGSSRWTFHAQLGASHTDSTWFSDPATVKEIIASVFGDSATFELPDFVAQTKVKSPVIALDVTRTKGGYFVLGASVRVGSLEFTFAQLRHQDWKDSVPSKGMIKVSVTGLPSVPIPLVGDLAQPFDQMYFVWAQDSVTPPTQDPDGQGTDSATPPAGLTRAETDQINQVIRGDSLLFKETKSGTALPADVVIKPGSHLVLILKSAVGQRHVVLDYAFAHKTKEQTQQDKTIEGNSSGDAKKGHSDELDVASDSSVAPVHVSRGVFAISNIGFRYEGGVLTMLLDASIAVGPVGVAVLGLSIGIDLKYYTLWDLPPLDDFTVSINGLGVAFSRPPMELAGVFLHSHDSNSDSYAGGAIVALNLYLLQAAGFYGQVGTGSKSNPDDKFLSIFVFAKLLGPLVELEFGEISGVTGGFGYNSSLRPPAVSEVCSFPFVDTRSLKDKPLDVLTDLVKPGGWFTPKEHSYWLAAGLKVDTFQLLAISAVIVAQWKDRGLQLAIYGVGSADIPPAGQSPVTFARVEMGFLATVDVAAGVLSVEGQLSPASYLLDPNCHPNGGFALRYWFLPGSPRVGDWVFSIGGYHEAFDVPEWYPRPQPVGITWTVGDRIRITGSSYFAITPTTCMAGGKLLVVLTAPFGRGFFNASANFLANYQPFRFQADISVCVGIRTVFDNSIITSSDTGDIAAQVLLYGPPMGGRARVDFLVLSYVFDFGEDPISETKPLSLVDFYNLVLQLKGSKALREKQTPPANQAHRVTCQHGLLVPDGAMGESGAEPAVWTIGPSPCALQISCSLPVETVTLTCGNAQEMQQTWWKPIYAKPMMLGGASQLSSTMTVEIKGPLGEGQWTIEQRTSMLPKALWSEYKPSADPLCSGNNNIVTLLKGTSAPCEEFMSGIQASSPPATPSADPAFDLSRPILEELEAERALPENVDENSGWLPESEDAVPKDATQKWDKVRNTWMGDHSSQPDRFLGSWFEVFQSAWGLQSDKISVIEEAWNFGHMPKNLYRQFNNLYIEAPMINSQRDDNVPYPFDGRRLPIGDLEWQPINSL